MVLAETRLPRVTAISPALLRRHALPAIQADGSKEDRGRVLLVGGSREVAGALQLSALAALRAGAGRVQLATVEAAAPGLAAAIPEALVIGLKQNRDGELSGLRSPRLARLAAHADAICLGPGMFHPAGSLRLLLQMLEAQAAGVWVLDACAVHALRGHDDVLVELAERSVLTPHAGEMARLLGVTREAVTTDAAACAGRFSVRHRLVVALKGAETLIAAPDRAVYRNRRGNPGLGTAGSGDVLAGIIAGLAAGGASPLAATLWGVHVHALAGERLKDSVGPIGYLARELLPVIPGVLSRCGAR